MSTTYTPHEIRAAILKAADHIERNPTSYNFCDRYIPDSGCGTTACMWGWIGHFLGLKGSNEKAAVACGLTKADSRNGFSPTGHLYEFCKSIDGPTVPAELHRYADAFYPATTPSAAPMDPAYLAFRAGFSALAGVEVAS